MQSIQHLERDIRLLKLYAALTTLVLAIAVLGGFRQGQKTRFDEIDVERINIVEPNGQYRMVLSNRPRSIGPIYQGKPFGYPGGGRPGIIFFNDEGTENGGLTFTGSRGSDGRYTASTHMSFDQFDQDQVLNLDYADRNGQRRVGFSIDDRLDLNIFDLVQARDSINRMTDTVARNAALARLMGPRDGVPLRAQRLFVGRDPAKSAVVNLADRDGRVRLRMLVDSLGRGRIEFLDPSGRVTYAVSGTGR